MNVMCINLLSIELIVPFLRRGCTRVNRTVTLLLSVDSFVHMRMSFIILEKWSFISLSCWHVDK